MAEFSRRLSMGLLSSSMLLWRRPGLFRDISKGSPSCCGVPIGCTRRWAHSGGGQMPEVSGDCRYPLVGGPAPDFETDALMPSGKIEKVSLNQLLSKRNGLCIIFYPLNFTFVCPTELLAFNKQLSEFEKRNWALIGISVDSAYSHAAWVRLQPSEGGVGSLSFPLLSDLSKGISKAYGVLSGGSVALRGAVLVDAEGLVRHLTVNDLSMGRSVEETLRVVDMIEHVRKTGGTQVCPANWAKGRLALSPNLKGVLQYVAGHAEETPGSSSSSATS